MVIKYLISMAKTIKNGGLAILFIIKFKKALIQWFPFADGNPNVI